MILRSNDPDSDKVCPALTKLSYVPYLQPYSSWYFNHLSQVSQGKLFTEPRPKSGLNTCCRQVENIDKISLVYLLLEYLDMHVWLLAY